MSAGSNVHPLLAHCRVGRDASEHLIIFFGLAN